MALSTVVHRACARLTNFTGRKGRPKLTRIQRRARDLMSFASVFEFCTFILWLMIALMLWEASSASSIDPAAAQRTLERWHLMPNRPFNSALLGLTWLLAFIGTMAPLVCLRRLGTALYRQAPLSFVVAKRFRWLGHALVANILVSFIAGLMAASQTAQYQLTFSLGFWGTVTAAILAYVVADMVREGARATEENREFI
ncbi:MAG: hypothetical protein ABI299_00010 [Rhodanobacter sp.]